MLDYTIAIAPEWHEALQTARTLEAEKKSWLRKLREIEKRERRDRRAHARTVVVNQPANLAGPQKFWI